MSPSEVEALWSAGNAHDALEEARAALLQSTSDERYAMGRALFRIARDRVGYAWREALPLATELTFAALAPNDPRRATVELPVAESLRREGDFVEADEVLARCLAKAEDFAAVGSSKPLCFVALELARLRAEQGRDGEAEEWLRRAVDDEIARKPAEGYGLHFAPFSELKQFLIQRGRFGSAADVHWSELKALAGYSPVSPHDYVLYLIEAGELSRRAGRLDESAEATEHALDTALASSPASGLVVARTRKAYAETLIALDRREEAVAQLAEAESAVAEVFPPDHPEMAEVKRLMREAAAAR
jgi:tetratricopeptide (TPR) repeat protein